MAGKDKKEIDKVSGVETTGHEWDGLKELNNPLPRWWVWVWLVTIIWSIWYWVLYPAWPVPGGATEGTKGYTQFKELAESQKEILARQQQYLDRFDGASFKEIMNDKELYAFAMAGGASAFKDNCATCHGSGAQGSKGYPNLNDDDWLWGGKLSDIYYTIKHGIRSSSDETHSSNMPAFGKDGLLDREEIDAVVGYVLTLSGAEHKNNYSMGQEIFAQNCAACHGDKGQGGQEFGAPNLSDKIWLYGGKREDIFYSVYNARAGIMPTWKDRLDENTIKELAVYVHQLGGGEVESDSVTIQDDEEEAAENVEQEQNETSKDQTNAEE